MRNEFVVFSLLAISAIGAMIYFWGGIPFVVVTSVLLVLLIVRGYIDMFQKKHAIKRNFPILGSLRYLMEDLRPKMYQYFIESDTNGTPINRVSRSVVYQRAKRQKDTTPFGTQMDVYGEGYEWMNHSIAALDPHHLVQDPRIMVGGKNCKQPYSCSIFNVSAMSFGSLSSAAIEALNGGAKIGFFAHNTGEGGISPYHLAQKGDLIWQIGTGYFGCRADDGNFDPDLYRENSQRPEVKMIELKLSQGAKPGHGGILPAKKNTLEISKIRNVEPGTAVLSPPYHKAFNTPVGMMQFIGQLQELSGGKPVGFKLCVGRQSEIFALCKAMIKTGIKPDFISVDGGEGGTGAAPPEFSNSVGMPFKEGVAFMHNALRGFGLREDIKIFASGKIITSFHIFRALALGADACYSARAMMLALGCIQALECNKNSCPTGVATQDKELIAGLVVSDKKERVASYQNETIKNFVELLAAAGLEDTSTIDRSHVFRRISMNEIKTYREIYPYIPTSALLSMDTCPDNYKTLLQESVAESFQTITLH